MAKLEKEFIEACKKYHGKLEKSSLFLLECDLSKKDKTHLSLGIHLQIEGNLPDLKVVTGLSNAELRYVDKITVESTRIVAIGEDKTVVNIYPSNGAVYFSTYGKRLSGELASPSRNLMLKGEREELADEVLSKIKKEN